MAMTTSSERTSSFEAGAAHTGHVAGLRSLLGVAAAHWLAGTVAVVAGVALAPRFVPFCAEHPFARRGDLIAGMAAWDGRWYRQIADIGYSYDPKAPSSVAFFPAYPLLTRFFAYATGLSASVSLIVVSNACFLAALLVTAAYLRERTPRQPSAAAICSLLALAWFPTTFYFRMAYSESLLLLLMAVILYGVRRAWPLWRLALLVGAATAVRPVGVALLAPLVVAASRKGVLSRSERRQWRGSAALAARLGAGVSVLLLACWGLLAFVAYQAWALGEPLAFVKTQAFWNTTLHRDFFWERALRVVSCEPLRAVYDPSTSFYWALRPPRDCAALNMAFANPIYFLATAAVVALGAIKRWLAADEIALAAALLLIPYALRGDQTGMASQARFASVVLPAYLVWGRLLSAISPLVRYPLTLVWGAMLATYSAFFVSWYWYY